MQKKSSDYVDELTDYTALQRCLCEHEGGGREGAGEDV